MPLQVVPSQLLSLGGVFGPMYGCFVNPTKSWLILNSPYAVNTSERLANSGLNITSEGEKGAALGLHHCAENYIREMVKYLLPQVT